MCFVFYAFGMELEPRRTLSAGDGPSAQGRRAVSGDGDAVDCTWLFSRRARVSTVSIGRSVCTEGHHGAGWLTDCTHTHAVRRRRSDDPALRKCVPRVRQTSEMGRWKRTYIHRGEDRVESTDHCDVFFSCEKTPRRRGGVCSLELWSAGRGGGGADRGERATPLTALLTLVHRLLTTPDPHPLLGSSHAHSYNYTES